MSYPIEGSCDAHFKRVREVFEHCLEKNREVGAAIAFYLDGKPVVDLWAGSVDRAGSRPWRPDTLVNTYSTTKGMTALCAHQLVERGKLDLDAPVARYWPEFAAAGKEAIPVRWLLTHRAGLPAVREPLPEGALYDWDAMASALARETPAWEPGSQQGYHPLTFGFLVGEVIRRVSGLSVGEWFRREVAGPLEADFHIGLPASEHGRVSDIIGTLAPPPPRASSGKGGDAPATRLRVKGPLADFFRDMVDPTTLVGAAFNNPRQRADAVNSPAWRSAEIPAGNGHGTALALARIYGALARGGAVHGVRLLEGETIEAARSESGEAPDAVLGGIQIRYGQGFMLRNDVMPFSPGRESFGHPGAGGSLGMADPESGTGFGYVMNRMKPGLTGGATAYAVLRAFYEAL